MKKYISCLLVLLALALPMLGMEADAATIVDSGSCGENVTWTLDNKGTLTISGGGDTGDYDSPWYSQQDSILSVVVEEGITRIGEGAFDYCDNIINITLPESLIEIGDDAFSGCESLVSITIPEGVTSIGSHTFYNCESLSSITLPKSLTSIGDYAFYECGSLSSIILPKNITTIAGSAFEYCDNLTSVTLPENLTNIDDHAFAYCGSLNSIALPENLSSIDDYAFSYCENLTNITFPENLTSIGDSAFNHCKNLTSITIPGSVSRIEDSAFAYCDSLTSVTISKGIVSIGDYAFESCKNLTNVTMSEGVTSIGSYAFSYCSRLSNITLPESILLVRKNAFGSCRNLTTAHYAGTKAQKEEITFLSYNEDILDATWHYECTGDNCPNPFVDVVADAYYAEPVRWAVNNGITNGFSANTFAPEATCTRGQIVTFLWRANGSPYPETYDNPFWDVNWDDYFEDAVLWAVENGITSGMGDGSFAPGAPCTRGQVATFLWRACGQPAPSGTNIFTDNAPGAYYYDAVLWAVEQGITNGMGDGTFAPDAPCTRGQIVTFLYRAMA